MNKETFVTLLHKIRTHPSLRAIDALIAAAIFTSAAAWGFFDDIDAVVDDRLYQYPGEKSSDIVVIGIDADTLDELGTLSHWSRRNLAHAIELMDEGESKPAVIGVDLLLTGSNKNDIEGDRILAKTVEKYGNVVMASAVVVDENVKNDDDSPNFPWNLSWPWDRPYAELAAAADTGHIAAAEENIVRHAVLYVDTNERGRIYSFARVIYEKYCAAKSIAPNPLPQNAPSNIFYIPFTAQNYTCGYNLLDLLEGKIPPEFYENKIVLIGPYASGMADSVPTAFDHDSYMYGIDIHANIIQTFQNNFVPYEASKRLLLIILFVVCFAAEFYFRQVRLNRAAVLWAVCCAGWIAVAQAAYKSGVVLPAFWIPLSTTVLFVGSVVSNYQRESTERERIRHVFSRYVDPSVMDELLKKGDDAIKASKELLDIAVLFVDIRGFTAMSEKVEADKLGDILNCYLDFITKCIYKNHGTLDKFIGDAVMAFWNAPLKQ